jgi:uncharacterized protein YkwD
MTTASVCATSAICSTPAVAATSPRHAFVQDTNHARLSHDRRAYRVCDDLTRTAQRWANWMARHHSLQHNPSLGSDVHNWNALGENVGRGRSESSIHHAFMSSPPHRDNILSRQFTQVGIATARDSNGQIYVDEVFRRPGG